MIRIRWPLLRVLLAALLGLLVGLYYYRQLAAEPAPEFDDGVTV